MNIPYLLIAAKPPIRKPRAMSSSGLVSLFDSTAESACDFQVDIGSNVHKV